MTYAQRLRKLADSTGLDAFGDEIRAIADEMDEQPADVTDDVVRDAERWRYAIADGGNQSMNFIDIFDDWDGDGSFVEAFDKARLADKKEGSAA